MDFTVIVQRLNELTTFMNNVRTLSKKIFELPDETAGNKLVAVWNETDNETQKFDLTAALQGMYSLTNGLTAIGNIVRDGADFTFEVGFEWKINGIEYENAEITRTINDAGTGNHRIDIAVADINNDIYIVEGFEVPLATAVVQPPTPPNTVFLCSFLIAESVIGDNTSPETSGQNNIPLKVDILSTDLATNDIAGFVTYINELNPPLTVLEINSFVQFYLTDTNEIYQFVGVGKGIYGQDNLQITSSNVIKFSTTPTFQSVIEAGDELVSDDNLRKIVISKEGQSIYFYGRADVGDAWNLIHTYSLNGIDTKSIFFKIGDLDEDNSGTGIEINNDESSINFFRNLENFMTFNRDVIGGNNSLGGVWNIIFSEIENSITLNIPNKPSGSYTFAMLDDLLTVVVSSNTTAENDTHYTVVANAKFTDPTPVEGKGYIVFVRNGTATIDGTGYGVGSLVYRVYHSGAWSNTVFIDQTQIGSATQTALDKRRQILYSKNNATLGSHTGNTAETVLFSIPITGGKFEIGDWMDFMFQFERLVTGTNIIVRLRAGINGNTSDALISTLVLTSATLEAAFKRERFEFNTGNILKGVSNSFSTSQIDIALIGAARTSTSLNPANNWNLTVAAALGSGSDTVLCTGYQIGKTKTF